MREIWANTALTEKGWERAVLIGIRDDGRIESVRAGQPKRGKSYSTILPAPVNLHSHAFQRAIAGLTESRSRSGSESFWSWRTTMYSYLCSLDPDDVEAIARLAQIEMLESGYAAVAEFHYLHHDKRGNPYADLAEMSKRILSAAVDSGIGITMLPVAYERGGCDGRRLSGGQLRFGNTLDRLVDLLEQTSAEIRRLPNDSAIGLAIHSLRAVASSTMKKLLELGSDIPIHIHIAEQTAEVGEVVSFYGSRPIEWLLGNFDVNESWCLIHCTHMLDHETIGLADSGAVVGLCPVTESNLGDGIFDGVRFLHRGGIFGVGTDSNVRISLADELRTLEYSQRLRHRGRVLMTSRHNSCGRQMFEAVCIGGAQAAARASGQIRVNNWADLLELREDDPVLCLLEEDQILDAWIFAGRHSLVRNVWSAGRHVVKDGVHIKREAVEKHYRLAMKRLKARLYSNPSHR